MGCHPYRACESVHTPSIDLWRILFDGIVVDELGEKTHDSDRASCRSSYWETRVVFTLKVALATGAAIRGTINLCRLGRLGFRSTGWYSSMPQHHSQASSNSCRRRICDNNRRHSTIGLLQAGRGTQSAVHSKGASLLQSAVQTLDARQSTTQKTSGGRLQE
jgi:hypothetical protein